MCADAALGKAYPRGLQSCRARGCCTPSHGKGGTFAMPRSLRRSLHLANCVATDPALMFAALEAGTVVHEVLRRAKRLWCCSPCRRTVVTSVTTCHALVVRLWDLQPHMWYLRRNTEVFDFPWWWWVRVRESLSNQEASQGSFCTHRPFASMSDCCCTCFSRGRSIWTQYQYHSAKCASQCLSRTGPLCILHDLGHGEHSTALPRNTFLWFRQHRPPSPYEERACSPLSAAWSDAADHLWSRIKHLCLLMLLAEHSSVFLRPGQSA